MIETPDLLGTPPTAALPCSGICKVWGQESGQKAYRHGSLSSFFLSSACSLHSPVWFLPFLSLSLDHFLPESAIHLCISVFSGSSPPAQFSIAVSLSHLCLSGFWCLSSLSLVPDQMGKPQNPAKAHSADSPTSPLINHQ